MLLPCTVTESASRLRRRPPQSLHGTSIMNSCSSMRTVSDSDSSYRRSTFASTPSHSTIADALRACRFALAAVENRVAHALRQIAPRRVEVELELTRQRRQHDLAQIPARLAPRQHHALENRDRGSPRMSCSLTRRRVPSPPHVGHAPNGELNEKWRGSSSGSEMPQLGQP